MGKQHRGSTAGWSSAVHELIDRVFVYGSLRAGQTARPMIAEYISHSEPATMSGTLHVLEDGYPVIAQGHGTVIGELLHLGDLTSALPLLDAYEGDSYSRNLQPATLADGTTSWAWVYGAASEAMLNDSIVIESGDWDRFIMDNPQ